jgi:hypothetical protein
LIAIFGFSVVGIGAFSWCTYRASRASRWGALGWSAVAAIVLGLSIAGILWRAVPGFFAGLFP